MPNDYTTYEDKAAELYTVYRMADKGIFETEFIAVFGDEFSDRLPRMAETSDIQRVFKLLLKLYDDAGAENYPAIYSLLDRELKYHYPVCRLWWVM